MAASVVLAAQEPPAYRAETRLVVVHATVRNRAGHLVTDLPREAFAVYENGKAQPITVFSRDDVPVSLGILIDNSGSMRRKRRRVEAAALALVRASNAQDEVFVLNFADKWNIDVPFTSDPRELEAGISRLDSIGGTAMRDAVARGEEYLNARATRDRRALLLITDGYDNASRTTLDAITAVAQQHDDVVYAIGLVDEAEPAKSKRERHELTRLADATGGVAYFPGDIESIDNAALELARQIRHQYTIGYTPLNQALDGSYRKIRLVASGSQPLTVRTRPGYRAVQAGTGQPPDR